MNQVLSQISDPRILYRRRVAEFFEGTSCSAQEDTIRSLLCLKILGVIVISAVNVLTLGLCAYLMNDRFVQAPFWELLALSALLAIAGAATVIQLFKACKLPSDKAWPIASGPILSRFGMFTTTALWFGLSALWLAPYWLTPCRGCIGSLG